MKYNKSVKIECGLRLSVINNLLIGVLSFHQLKKALWKNM